MKTLSILGLVFGVCLSSWGQGQVILLEGDSYTFEFATLELDGPETEPIYSQYGRLDVWFADFQSDETLRIELFEDSPSEPPVYSGPWNGGGPPPIGPPTPNPLFVLVPNAWEDLQGIVRFTMVTGSMTISRVDATAVRSDAGGLMRYSSTVPIPEPCGAALVFSGVSVLLLTRFRGATQSVE